jgi:sugar phosphate isomerase/epimerase
MRRVGLVPLLMTTAVEDAGNSTDKKVLEVASKLGIKYYRMNWFSYPEEKPIPDALKQFQQKIKDLSNLNREMGLTGCYQNHAGNLVGASLWELWELLKEADKQYMGLQYDIRHAVVEGGKSWQNGLRLVQSLIKTLVIKDFLWEKREGQWNPKGVPLGAGMVDFKTYFRLLKQYKVNVPVSLHMEHPLGGAEQGETKISVDKKVVFDAMKKDLQKVHELWQQT